jgi:cation transporter-like permease
VEKISSVGIEPWKCSDVSEPTPAAPTATPTAATAATTAAAATAARTSTFFEFGIWSRLRAAPDFSGFSLRQLALLSYLLDVNVIIDDLDRVAVVH